MLSAVKFIAKYLAAIGLGLLVPFLWHSSKLLSFAALVGFAVLAAIIFYQESLKRLRKTVIIYGPTERLKPSDIRPSDKWYNPFYIEPPAVTRAVGMLNANNNVVLLGVPLLGKTRCAFEVLKRLRGFHVLYPKPEIQKVGDIKVPRTYLVLKPRLVLFLDDLESYVGKFLADNLCRHLKAQSRSLTVLATCRTQEDWEKTHKDKAFATLLEDWDLKEILLEKLSRKNEKTLADHFHRPWHESAYDGRPGFIVLGLERMKKELLRVTPPGLDLMRGLNLMHEAGLRSYRYELALKAAQLFDSRINPSMADQSFMNLSDIGFLVITANGNLVSPTHARYLETSFSEKYATRNLENLSSLCQLISDDGQATETFSVGLHCLRRGEVAMSKDGAAIPYFAMAEKSFTRFLELAPRDADGHYYLATVFGHQDNKERAEAELREAIRYNPNHADAHYDLGVMKDSIFDDIERELYKEEQVLAISAGNDRAEPEYRETIRCNPNHAAAHYRIGVKLLDRGWMNEKEAEKEFREAIRSNAKYARGHLGVGRILDSRGLSIEAERYYQRAINEDAGLSYAHYRLGLLMSRRDDRSGAEAEYRKAICLDPLNAEAYHGLGWLLYKQGQLKEAEKQLREAVRLEPDSSSAHNTLGLALMDQTRDEEALVEYHEALRCDSSNFYALTNVGLIFARRGEFEQAEKTYREAISLEPAFSEAHCELGYVLEELNRFDEAENEYREAIRLSPDHSRAHNSLGALLQNSKRDLAAAEAEYREAIRCDPRNSVARVNLGWMLLLKQHYEEAEVVLREALTYDPAYARAHNHLGLSFAHRQRWDEAETELRKAIECAPADSTAHLNLGWIRSEQGDVAEEEEQYREAILLDPKYSMAHNNLGRLLLDRGDLVQAEKHIREAIAADPDNTLAYENLGDLLQQKGALEEAIQAYLLAIDHWERGRKEYLTVISRAAVKEKIRIIRARLSRLKGA